MPSLDDSLRVVICDAARPLATRLWESWLPSSAEGADGGDVASARISIADVLQVGSISATWRLVSKDRVGVEEHCGVVAMRLAWLPAL